MGKDLHDVDDDLRQRLGDFLVGVANARDELRKDDEELVRLQLVGDAPDVSGSDLGEALLDVVQLLDGGARLGSLRCFFGKMGVKLYMKWDDAFIFYGD